MFKGGKRVKNNNDMESLEIGLDLPFDFEKAARDYVQVKSLNMSTCIS